MVQFELLAWNFPAGLEENYDEPQSEYLVFESITSKYKVWV